jgi:hypothetical protein
MTTIVAVSTNAAIAEVTIHPLSFSRRRVGAAFDEAFVMVGGEGEAGAQQEMCTTHPWPSIASRIWSILGWSHDFNVN